MFRSVTVLFFVRHMRWLLCSIPYFHSLTSLCDLLVTYRVFLGAAVKLFARQCLYTGRLTSLLYMSCLKQCSRDPILFSVFFRNNAGLNVHTYITSILNLHPCRYPCFIYIIHGLLSIFKRLSTLADTDLLAYES